MKVILWFLHTTWLLSSVVAQNFSTFRSCLIERGFRSSGIVRRTANSKEYADLNYQFRLNPPQIYPLAYVLPSYRREVQVAVFCGNRDRINLVARSGGHQYHKYAYGTADSVVVDLRRMDRVAVNDGRTLARVGGGAILGHLNWKLWTQGKVFFPNGLCPMVGIGGLAPNGGHGYFARQYGLTTDYITEVDIVVASGAVVTANSDTNSDLLWALRGGGGASFGIITRFTFKVLPPPVQIYEGMLQFRLRQFPEVFEAWQQFFVNGPKSVTPNFRVRNGGNALELHFFDSTGTPDNFRRIEQNFPKNRNRSRAVYTYPEFLLYNAKNFGGSLKPGIELKTPSDLGSIQRGSSKQERIQTKSYYVQKLLTRAEIQELYSILREMPKSVRCRFEGYGGAINDLAEDATAFIHRRRFFNSRATVDYQLITDAEEGRVANRFLSRFYSFGTEVLRNRETYQNYVDADMSDYLRRYYGRNLRRLIQVKSKYDPKNYFRNPQSIPTSSTLAGESNTTFVESS